MELGKVLQDREQGRGREELGLENAKKPTAKPIMEILKSVLAK